MQLPIGTYTFYNNFENCPHKAYHLYVVKDIPKTPPSPEQKWGQDVHEGLERRIRDGVALPETMQGAESVAAALHRMKDRFPIEVEHQLAMTAEGKPCGYWDKGAWFRGKLDVSVLHPQLQSAWVLDWKTGKVREEPLELETGALLLRVNYPEVNSIVGEYFWMQTGQNGIRYTLNNQAQTFGKLQSLRHEAEGYAASGVWPKRRNGLCGWCPVVACEHNTSHRRK